MGKDGLIYHYCSVDTLYNIITKKKLWLSDSSYMNDKEEVTWIDTLVFDALNELIDAYPNEKKYSKIEEEYKKLEHKKHFIMCFSKEKDKLSQWRAYADDAKGVAIGFNANCLKDREELSGQIGSEPPQSVTKQLGKDFVEYDENHIKNNFKNIIEKSESMDIQLIAFMIKESSIIIKHPSFKEEEEVRFIYTPENTSNQNSQTHLSSKKLFRSQKNEIIPYFTFDFKDFENFISEIVLGSKCKLKKDDLQEFLVSEEFNDIKINYSFSSYR